MINKSNNQNILYKLGNWIAEPGKTEPGREEFYSPGEVFIRADSDEGFRVPRFLGEGNTPQRENLLKLIDVVSQEMIETIPCELVYLVSLGENKKGLHFRLLPRYHDDQGILDELDNEIKDTNDGLALMARWRKQFLLKKMCANSKPFDNLRKKHEEAIEKVRKALHKRALTEQNSDPR